MSVLLIHATTVFMGFFAIMNPIANVPIFLSITANTDQTGTESRGLPIADVGVCDHRHFRRRREAHLHPLWHHSARP